MGAIESYNAFLKGDQRALEGVVSTYARGIVGFLCGYVGVTEAEDLCEDAFVALIEQRKRFAAEEQLRCWLYQTAKHKALNFLRRAKKSAPLEDTLAAEGYLEESLFAEERKQSLYRGLETLDLSARQMLYLVYFEGFRYAEVARILGIPEKKVDNTLYLAKKKLSVTLKELQ